MDGLRPLSLPVIARAAAQDGAGLLDYGADPMVDPLARPLAASEQPLVLLVEDSAAQARAYLTYMANLPCRVDHVETGADALEKIRSDLPTLVLLDINLPDGSGIDVLKTLRAEANKTAVVMITSHGSINMAVDAMAAGAIDFLVKPFNQDRLRVTVGNVLERLELTRQVETLKAGASLQRFQGFVGSSPQMQQVFSILTSAAGSMATVFITGESGTGKEVAAETLHRQSPRHRGAFVPINCAAIPTDLMESEIFGHVKGAFTGAVSDREGAAQRAHGGTLFLDEICEMDPNLQTKLLRFLQTGKVQKVGGDQAVPVDVRIVCATNRDPLREVQDGRFREDLYYRLHVIPVHLPPLRDRGKDVVAIARYYLDRIVAEEGKQFRGFSPEAEQVIARFSWPGNVRQMVNVLRNIVVLNDGDQITVDLLPIALVTEEDQLPSGAWTVKPAAPQAHVPEGNAASSPGQNTLQSSFYPEAPADQPAVQPLWRTEREAIERAIAHCNGNIVRAAGLLEVSPSTLYRKRQAWEDR